MSRCKKQTIDLHHHPTAQENVLRFKCHLQAKVCVAHVTGCVVGIRGTDEEGEDPWTEVGGLQAEGVAWGEGGEK